MSTSPSQRLAPSQQLAECTALEYILLGDLRDLLQEPMNEQTAKWLLAVLDALLETVPHEFRLQEQDGYLTEVTDQYPEWSDQVERLRHEHTILFRKLKRLRNQVARHDDCQAIAAELRGELREWITTFVAHHRHENRIVQTAMNLEVGGGD